MARLVKFALVALCAFATMAHAAPLTPAAADNTNTAVHAENVPVIEADHLYGTVWRRVTDGEFTPEIVDFLALTPSEWSDINAAVERGEAVIETGAPNAEDANGNLVEMKVVPKTL